MGVYVGGEECRVVYVARNGQQLRVSSVWVGDQQVFPPADRQEIHLFTRDTQGYGRVDNGTHFAFSVPVPWWATSMDVVIIGAGEKGRDGTKSFTGGTNGAGGKSGAWVVKTLALPESTDAVVRVGKGTSTAPHATEMILPGVGGQADVRVHDGEGTRTANSGSTGGTPSPQTRTEFDNFHAGGSGGSRNNPGNHPGGGGGGGQGSGLLGNPTTGRNGGDGYVWLRFRSAPALFILRVGVASGAAFEALREWAVSIGKTYQTITEITVPMEVIGPSLNSLFSGCYALASMPALDTSQVTDMYAMFNECSSLESVTLPGMGQAFTSSQTLGMKDTKLNASAANALMQSLGTVPAAANGTKLELPATATGANRSIATAKNWTVTISDGGVILRVGVASGAAYVPLREWAVSIGQTYQTITEITVPMEVIGPSLYGLFYECHALTSVPALNTSQVTDMYAMFNECSSLASIPALNTSNVIDMNSMFSYCSSLTTVPELDTSNVTDMNSMFIDCSSLTTVPELNTSNVTDTGFMFYNCSALTTIPALNTSKVTNMNSMFYSCSSLTSVPALNTSKVTNMRLMFFGCSSLTSVPDLDTSQVIDMRSMFYDCSSLTSVPALNTSQVTDMYAMFVGCSALTTIPALNTSKVTNMRDMFWGCSALETVTLPGAGNGFTTNQTLNMKATKLNAAAANALMQSLGTPPPGGTLQLPATATGANTSIATAKNWTVTFG